ncbi:MAG: 3-isopropylmalate dehydratase small subunit [Pseudomonadales bacterium]
MKPFTEVTGLVAPLERDNVDTDQIIPKQYLKSIRRTGFGDHLFDSWRFEDEGDIGVTPNERRINRGFVLNQPRFQGAQVLVAGRNFGCGSSREHAVWALAEYGFRCVIAPSYADIFFSNCFKNGFLPIVLEEKIVQELMALANQEGGLTLTVDLPAQQVRLGDGRHFAFDIEADKKRMLVEGLDDIGLTLAEADAIRAFEARHRQAMPWLFRDGFGAPAGAKELTSGK